MTTSHGFDADFVFWKKNKCDRYAGAKGVLVLLFQNCIKILVSNSSSLTTHVSGLLIFGLDC